jgi:glycosyltransferase involved in cell wall biosynthesis
MKLRVLHAGKFYAPVPGGIETVLAQVCIDTAERWHVRAVVANQMANSVRELKAGVEVLRAGALGKVASVPLCPTLPLRLWQGSYDCAILHEPNPLAAAALFCRTPAARLIIWHHSDLVRPSWAPLIYGPVQRQLYRRADCVIVSSPPLAKHSPIVQHARRVEVVPYGITVENYSENNPDRHRRVEQIKALYPGPRIVFVGRLVYYKGLDVLLRAMTSCGGTLFVVGEGPLDRELHTLTQELGLASRVVFLSGLSNREVIAHYHASDIFVLPSLASTEAFGITQVEAMACGLPVVSTRLSTGVPRVNQHGVTGLVVPPKDPRPLAHAIQQLIDDPSLRSRLGAGARHRARTQFSRQRMVEQFVAVVESVITGEPIARPSAAPETESVRVSATA